MSDQFKNLLSTFHVADIVREDQLTTEKNTPNFLNIKECAGYITVRCNR